MTGLFLVHCARMSRAPVHHPLAVAPKGEQRGILWHGLLAFFVTGGLAVAAAQRAGTGGYVPSAAVSVPYALTVVLIGTLLLLLALRKLRSVGAFQALFTLAMLSGAWFLADIYLPPSLALLAGSLAVAARFAWKSVLAANLTLALGVAGIAAGIAAGLSPNAILLLLAVLSFYDIVAVYRTGHMTAMFRGLAARGVVLAFVLTPLRLRALVSRPDDPSVRGMHLGTGDVALPAMLAAAALRVGPVPAASALAGAAAGFALMFMLFLAQPKRAPMPALPPIALGASAGYLIAILLP